MSEEPTLKISRKLVQQDPRSWSWGTRIFAGLARLSYRFPAVVLVICISLALLCGWYTYEKLYFDSNRSNLIKRSADLQANQDRYVAEFPDAEDMVVIAEGGKVEERQAFMDDLGERLRAEPEVFNDVFEKIDGDVLRDYALHFVDADDLHRLDELLKANLPTLEQMLSTRSVIDLAPLLAENSFGDVSDDYLKQLLPVVNGLLEQLNQCCRTRGRWQYRSPLFKDIMGRGWSEEEVSQLSAEHISIYSTLGNGKLHLLLVRPQYHTGVPHEVSIDKAVVRLKAIVKEMAVHHPTVLTRITGELVLDYDEGVSSTNDSTLSSILSVILVSIIFVWAFREVYRPLMAVFSLGIGVLWTMGFTTLVVGHLNLLTVTCTTILIGLGIDYGIHFIYRYEEERVAGLEPLEAMTETLARAGQENFTGAFSTALAFWVLNLTDFTGIAELGTIAGSGILFCYASTVLVLPAFLYRQEKRTDNRKRVGLSSFVWLGSLERKWLEYPQLMGVLFLCFSLWCGYEAFKVHYDYNLLNLQSPSLESVRAELFLIESSEHSLLYGISLVKDTSEAKQLIKAYEKLPTVANTECVALMIPEDYQEKVQYLRSLEQTTKRLPLPEEWQPYQGSMIKRLLALGKHMESADISVNSMVDKLVHSSDKQVADQGVILKANLEELANTLSSMGPGPLCDSLEAFDSHFYGDLRLLVSFLKSQKAAPQLTMENIPDSLRRRELGKNKLFQVRVFPKENVWDREAQGRFTKDVLSVDPQAVGMPIMTYFDSQVLREANEQAGVYALVAIWVLLFLYFRNVKLALLALMPKVVGVLWMVGLMGACGVNFNSANFLALPMILGIGLVFGIHVVHRVLEEGDEGIFSHSTGPAIALAALTTMVGFGTLMTASYQGISSLGFVMTVGVGANLLSSAVLLPVVLKLMRTWDIKLRS